MSQPRQERMDRRHGRRLVFGRDQQPEVVLTFKGQRSMGHLLDLSEGGVRVALRRPEGAPPVGSAVDVLVLIGGGEVKSIEGLAVRRSAPEPDGRPVLAILAEDAPRRARLWSLLDSVEGSGGVLHSTAQLEELPKIPGRGDYSEEARVERLAWLSKGTGAALAALHTTQLSAERLSSNLENMIGSVEIPVGIAGPLRFRGHEARGIFYAPMATTEGALVASATRGATAISRANGVVTRVLSQRMLRVPCFTMSSLRGAVVFASWIRDHVGNLREQSARISRHAKLASVEPTLIGNVVNVAFVYETGDAAGQNMTTACTWACCQWLLEQMRHIDGVRIDDFIIEANMSGDKKVTYQSFIAGRGIRVVAEANISTDVLASVLKVTPDQLGRANRNIMAGSIHTGMIGYNINVANVIAAMFAATGQDIACVHECSLGQFSLETTPEGVYASIVLPALIVGTVGGGTHLPSQSALLEMMGCAGAGNVGKLAEIIAGFCLALDLSTLSAVASGQFASAHERLGRNRPVDFFAAKDLTPAFFTAGVRRVRGDDELTVTAAEATTATLGSSIVTELTGRAVSKVVGFFPYRLTSETPGRGALRDDVLVKVKPLDEEVILMVNRMASMCGPRVANAHNKARHRTGFKGCHLRELAIYAQTDPRFRDHAPRCYETFRDERREAYVLVLERLTGVTHLDQADDPVNWNSKAIERALQGIAEVHAIWMGREPELLAQPWIGEPHTTRSMHELRDLWGSLATHAAGEFPELITPERLELLRRMIRSVAHWWPTLESLPRTLIHGDFNPRNVCLRDGRLCAYDWELATIQVPQRDVAELLAFVLHPNAERAEIEAWISYSHEAEERACGHALETEAYRRGFVLSLRDFAVNRLMLYLMAHTFKQYKFLPRVVETLFRMLDVVDQENLPELPLGASSAWPVARPI
ncbi:MAG TPA: phosphotransferase [Polyangiaceae bacterium]|jgi:NADP-dependent 3-hydroxy-3-methylglutaryl-CoA reductase